MVTYAVRDDLVCHLDELRKADYFASGDFDIFSLQSVGVFRPRSYYRAGTCQTCVCVPEEQLPNVCQVEPCLIDANTAFLLYVCV
jgi:hypothetical protein